jgi:hypothetical protein
MTDLEISNSMRTPACRAAVFGNKLGLTNHGGPEFLVTLYTRNYIHVYTGSGFTKLYSLFGGSMIFCRQ